MAFSHVSHSKCQIFLTTSNAVYTSFSSGHQNWLSLPAKKIGHNYQTLANKFPRDDDDCWDGFWTLVRRGEKLNLPFTVRAAAGERGASLTNCGLGKVASARGWPKSRRQIRKMHGNVQNIKNLKRGTLLDVHKRNCFKSMKIHSRTCALTHSHTPCGITSYCQKAMEAFIFQPPKQQTDRRTDRRSTEDPENAELIFEPLFDESEEIFLPKNQQLVRCLDLYTIKLILPPPQTDFLLPLNKT